MSSSSAEQDVSEQRAVRVLGLGGAVARRLPGYEHRPQQLRMAELIERAIREGRHAVVEAGTGTGKSLAYLVPAIQSGRRTICSTANKALQEQIARKDVPFLREVLPEPFTAVVLKGRRNYVCLQQADELRMKPPTLWGEFAGQTRTAAEVWPRLDEWIDRQEQGGGGGDLEQLDFNLPAELRDEITVDADACIGEKCPARARCFSEKAKEAARNADVVIVNHALLLRDLELRAYSEGQMVILPPADLCVVDEAHHLEEVATDAFGCTVTEYRWTRLANRVDRLTIRHPALVGEDGPGRSTRQAIREDLARYQAARPASAQGEDWMAKALEWQLRVDTAGRPFVQFFQQLVARFERASVQRLGDETIEARPAIGGLRALAREMREGIPAWLTEPQRESWQKLGKQVESLAADLELLATPGSEDRMVRYAQWEGQGERRRVYLYAKPIEVAEALREKLFGVFSSVVATSATLATDRSTAYWRGRVGLEACDELVLGSPFDYQSAALLYLPADGHAFDPSEGRFFEQSAAYLERLTDEIEALVRASRGRAFVLFTSLRVLNLAYERLAPRLGAYSVFKQGDLPRGALIGRFREAGNGVLFGTKSFWEGVDVAGEALSLVIIDKLPFAPPDDPVFDARKEAINRRYPQERGWAWWSRLAVPLAIISLKQGFGRLVRSRADRGVVALLDGRLTTKGYGPRIVSSLPPASRTSSLNDVRAFFRNGHSASRRCSSS